MHFSVDFILNLYYNNNMNKEINMKFTFADEIFSDLCKDVYGTRSPAREYGHLSHYYNETPENKQKIWDDLCNQLDDVMAEEAAAEKISIAAFESRVKEIISLGAGNRKTALRWILEGEFGKDLYHWTMQPGYACYTFGIPYSYEKEFEPIVKEAYNHNTFEEIA